MSSLLHRRFDRQHLVEKQVRCATYYLKNYYEIFIEFEQDSDELDDEAMEELNNSRLASRSRNSQTMPLLVGLFDTSASRRSVDASLPLHESDRNRDEANLDLDEIAAKRTAGGGMLDSVANMANSILGAGPLLTASSC